MNIDRSVVLGTARDDTLGASRIASLALAWGLCDLFRREGGGANLRVLDRHPNGEDAEEAALMGALCEEGECVCP